MRVYGDHIMIAYDETHKRIIENGINSIKEVFCSENVYLIKQILLCLDFYLDPHYKHRLPYEKEVYDLLQELVVSSQDNEVIDSCLQLIGDYSSVPLTIMERDFLQIKDNKMPYAKRILDGG